MTATEWTADPKREPIYVKVIWTDAASDNTFTCAISEVGKRATLMHRRQNVGHLVYVAPEGREAKVVLAAIYDAPQSQDEEAMFEDFFIIPFGWIERITVIRGPVIYERDARTPKVQASTERKRAPKQ